jgi:hypothetical protein
MVTLDQTKIDYINQLTTITYDNYLLKFSEWDIIISSHLAADNINQ